MDWWGETVAAAVVGTERRPLALPPAEGPLADLLGRLDQSNPQRALLGAAAVIATHRRAGRRLATDRQPLPTPCPPEELPACGPAAARRLVRLLGGDADDKKLVSEWLALAAAAGRLVPPAHLPALLEVGRVQTHLRAAILPVLGARGRWLAAQNPDWAYAIATDVADADEVWLTGERTARLALLRELRRRDPDRARDLLASTWSGEAVEQRTAFLAELATGLSLADEPFLEAALDDRRKPVRAKAAELLSRLPASRLVARMHERLKDAITIGMIPGRGRFKAPAKGLIVTLPAACDAAMVRDGIEAKPPYGLGERAWWLKQMVASIPPSFWTARLGQSPANLIALAASSKGGDEFLIEGWTEATKRHRDAAWAEALLEHMSWEDFEDLLGILSPAQHEAVVRRLLTAPLEAAGKRDPGRWLMVAARVTLRPDLGRAVLDRLRQSIRSGALKYDWQTFETIGALAHHLPVSLAGEAAGGWPTDVKHWQTWTEAVEQLTTLLQSRYEMHEEIAG